MPETMPVVTLQQITQENFQAVVSLQVGEAQKHFVASNAYSLAEAYIFPERVPLAIYAGEVPVGFVMYTFWEERQQYWIFRVMVASEHQGRGYGREGMRLLLDRMRAIAGCRQIYISYEPENDAARRLYASLGFQVTGEMVGGEEVACLEIA